MVVDFMFLLLVNSRLLIVKCLGSQKLYMKFCLCGCWHPNPFMCGLYGPRVSGTVYPYYHFMGRLNRGEKRPLWEGKK